MKLSEYRDAYYGASGTASTVCRQIAFAGVALVWVFKDGEAKSQALSLPQELLIPTALLIATLTFDLLQYASAAVIWGFYCRYKELQLGTETDPDLAVPIWLNWPAIVFFWSKLSSIILAYYFLFSFSVETISFR